jgi:hypothetical protein
MVALLDSFGGNGKAPGTGDDLWGESPVAGAFRSDHTLAGGRRAVRGWIFSGYWKERKYKFPTFVNDLQNSVKMGLTFAW